MKPVIIFDLGKVLFDIDYNVALNKIYNEFKDIDSEKINYLIIGDLGKKFRLGIFSKKEFYNECKKVIGQSFDFDKLLHIWYSTYTLNEDVFNLIKRLKKNYYLAILSSNIKSRIKFLEKKFVFKKYFNHILCSYMVKVNKPNIEIYKMLLKRINKKVNNCIFIDDKKINLVNAKKIGMNTILFTDYENLVNELKNLNIKV
jgi:HAD superfamily hydrolase (TIGR01509 family)